MWVSVGVAVLGVVAVLAWVGVTQPGNRPFVVVGGVLLAACTLVVLGRRTWVDPAHGTIVRETLFVRSGAIAWADAAKVALTDNRAGQLLLEVRGAGRRTPVLVPLVAVDVGGDRAQGPDLLRLLANQVERWAPQHATVVARLRAQADHLAGGGDVRSSPLAQRLGRARSH